MKALWQIDSQDVIGLQGRDVEFARFVNDLLTQPVQAARAPLQALRLNLKTQAPDGGVDAVVDQAVPNLIDCAGFLGVPTCWQFKACPSSNVKPSRGKRGGQEAALREEIRKPEAAKLIATGYGYRFCIADDLTPAQQAEWEAWLLGEARTISADPQPPKVVTASHLAIWANSFPGAILPFRPHLGAVSSLRTWGHDITAETPHFVPVAAWQASMETIRTHADLTCPCIRVVQTVQGEAGVGKTRCVYESLLVGSENRARVIYTRNEVEAEKFASLLASDSGFCGIIVADECSVESRVRLERCLQAYASRVRVIAIDNSLRDEATGSGEIRLVRLAETEVEQVLAEHFPELSWARRRAFVDLSRGFVRLALDLCRQSDLIPQEGHIGPVLDFFRDHYLRARLPREEERMIVEAVALLPKVGCRADVRQQLEWLCEATGLEPDRVLETALRLKQSPGFLALGERYLYVTPRLIAQAAFQAAWARWIRPDPERFFLDRLRGELLDGFADQLRLCGTADMRQVFSLFFRGWTNRLSGPDLADEPTVQRLVRLVEVEPDSLLPQVRRLAEGTPVEDLGSRHKDSAGLLARRELVWLAEKFLRLPEFFSDAERILLRLALAETEAYTNNASGVWKSIFQPFLSGTPIAFAERLQLLERRFQTPDEAQLALCLGALEGPLTAYNGIITGRTLGPPLVAGRIPPPDWHPANQREKRDCWSRTVAMLKKLLGSESAELRERVRSVIIHHLPGLLHNGILADAIELIGEGPLSDMSLAALLRALDRFLEVFCAPDAKRVPTELETAVRDWRRRLVPESLHGRLMSVVGQEPWHVSERVGDQGEEGLASLARELLHSPAALDQELPWLCSGEARSASLLGEALGRSDAAATRLEQIMNAAVQSRNSGIATGYVLGLLQSHPDQVCRVNELLDRLQQTHPRIVFDILPAGRDVLRPLERLLAMVDAGQLPVEYLRSVAFVTGPLSQPNLHQVLDRLIAAAGRGNSAAAGVAVEVLFRELRRVNGKSPTEAVPDPSRAGLLKGVLQLALAGGGSVAHAWAELLRDLARLDSEAAIGLAVQALASDQLDFGDWAEAELAVLAVQHPQTVMRLFGEAMLDPASGWRLGFRRLRALVSALPWEVVRGWLDEHGQRAAVALANHLVPPHLGATGNPVVPELTAYALTHFGGDEHFFGEFCTGVHTGRTYMGDPADQSDREAAVARRFLDHPLRGVREWAQYEIERAAHESSFWRARNEEMAAP